MSSAAAGFAVRTRSTLRAPGIVSVTTTSRAAPLPVLRTSIVYVSSPPASTRSVSAVAQARFVGVLEIDEGALEVACEQSTESSVQQDHAPLLGEDRAPLRGVGCNAGPAALGHGARRLVSTHHPHGDRLTQADRDEIGQSSAGLCELAEPRLEAQCRGNTGTVVHLEEHVARDRESGVLCREVRRKAAEKPVEPPGVLGDELDPPRI